MINLKEKVPIKIKVCPQCISLNVNLRWEIEKLEKCEHNKRWLDVRYLVPLVDCHDCGETSAAFEWYIAQHDAVLVAMGGMTVKQIKDLRKSLGFKSALAFSKYLGVGSATVKRWESRESYPTNAHIMLMKLAAAGVDLSIVKNPTRDENND